MLRVNPPRFDVDVLIVGAGPVGLYLANALGAASLRVLIVDALPTLTEQAQARQASWHAEENGAEAIRTIMREAADAAGEGLIPAASAPL